MATEPQVRTPLFDRLAGQERTLDRSALRESVRRELELLFNTRSTFPSRRLPGAPLTVIDYGIPPLTSFAVRSLKDQHDLADALRIAIEIYEPRLAAPRVEIAPPAEGETMALLVEIRAELAAGAVREPVTFVVDVDLRQQKVGVDARS